MAKYIDKNGNITFNSVPTSNFMQVGQLLSHPDLSGASDADLADIANDNGGKLPSKVNVVEIDWNGAQICNQTVNTTGQLLKIIHDLYTKVNNIPTDVKVTSISLDYTSSTWQTEKGKTKTVTATVNPSNATNNTIKWTSTNTNVATVSSTSAKTITVTCVGYGSATIKCTAQDGSGVYAKFDVKALEPTTTQASTPTPTPSSTDTPTPTDTPEPTTPTHYTDAVMLLGDKATAISSMTSSMVTGATSFTTKTVDTTSLGSYVSFPATTSRSSVIIRLNRYSTQVSVVYPTNVQFYDTTKSAWVDVAYGTEPIRMLSSGNYNYFVIHPASAIGVQYRMKFTTTNPGYATISGGTSGGTVEPSTTGTTSGSTPSSTQPVTT